MNILPRNFYARDTVTVARDLLGKKLVRILNGHRLAGIITETEAYRSDDPASHSYRGKTARNKSMFGPVGHSYVYFTYGMHYCLNIVSRDPKLFPAGGVLIRAVMPVEGLEFIVQNRGKIEKIISGPGKVAQAFGITRNQDGIDLTSETSEMYITEGITVDGTCVKVTPRIGISVAVDKLWRFVIISN